MNANDKLNLLKDRLSKLENSPKNIKSGGVVQKLRRQVRNMAAVVA